MIYENIPIPLLEFKKSFTKILSHEGHISFVKRRKRLAPQTPILHAYVLIRCQLIGIL